MRCSCCGRRRKFGEAFESVSGQVQICVECGQLIYRMRDAKREGNADLENEFRNEIEKRCSEKGSEDFQEWFQITYDKGNE